MKIMERLNPHHVALRRQAISHTAKQQKDRAALLEAKRTGKKVEKTKEQKNTLANEKKLRKSHLKARAAFKKQLFTK